MRMILKRLKEGSVVQFEYSFSQTNVPSAHLRILQAPLVQSLYLCHLLTLCIKPSLLCCTSSSSRDERVRQRNQSNKQKGQDKGEELCPFIVVLVLTCCHDEAKSTSRKCSEARIEPKPSVTFQVLIW